LGNFNSLVVEHALVGRSGRSDTTGNWKLKNGKWRLQIGFDSRALTDVRGFNFQSQISNFQFSIPGASGNSGMRNVRTAIDPNAALVPAHRSL
jgi:hypothetical protein